ncbi:MAG: NADH-quinone oxidoreductase subunit J, partial [Pirellulaceae bacterium]
LGTAGLFFFQGAQFLAIATIIVYAGAIVVTFLFVIMLAQPEGRASYDRVSWARSSKTASVVTAALLVALLTVTVKQAKPEPLPQKRLEAVLKTDHHVARLGNYLFTQRLIEIEVAGTLLLVALVGAVAILIHAKEASAEDPDPEHG